MRTLSLLSKFQRPSRFAIPVFFVILLWAPYMMVHRILENPVQNSPDVHSTMIERTTISKPPQRPKRQDYSPFCAPNECGKGRWIPHPTPFSTIAQAQDAFHSRNFDLCEVHYDHTTTSPSDEELQHARENRTIDISNWIWQPDNGQLLPWDADEFVARLCQSPGGMILIGDSLSRQHSQTVISMLQHSGLLLEEIRPETAWTPTAHITQIRLIHYESANQRAIGMAGVPLSRIDRPFLTIIEDHSLLQAEEIRILASKQPGDYFIHDPPSVPNWQGLIESLIEDRREEGVTKDNVVLLNTGAHWSIGELPQFVEGHDQLDHIMSQMINQIITRLSPLTNTTIYFRSTSPGHPVCERKTIPYSSISEARNHEANVDDRNEKVSAGRSKWNWGSFSRYNEFWKRAMEESNTRRDGLWKGNGATWKYLDVWDMSLQRVEAHTLSTSNEGKSHDCLHFCVPFVFREWTLLFAHAILVDGHLVAFKLDT